MPSELIDWSVHATRSIGALSTNTVSPGTGSRTGHSGGRTVDNQTLKGEARDMPSSSAAGDVGQSALQYGPPVAIRGWLLVYMIGLVIQALHGLVLTVGAVVIFADPARAGLTLFIPLGALLFYVTTNIVVAIFTTVVLALMIRRRKAAIVNSIVLNCLTVLFLMLGAPFRREVTFRHVSTPCRGWSVSRRRRGGCAAPSLLLGPGQLRLSTRIPHDDGHEPRSLIPFGKTRFDGRHIDESVA